MPDMGKFTDTNESEILKFLTWLGRMSRKLRLDLLLLIGGIILAAIGVYLWQDGLTLQSVAGVHRGITAAGYLREGGEKVALGLALAVLGGGAAIGAMVMLIVKRRE